MIDWDVVSWLLDMKSSLFWFIFNQSSRSRIFFLWQITYAKCHICIITLIRRSFSSVNFFCGTNCTLFDTCFRIFRLLEFFYNHFKVLIWLLMLFHKAETILNYYFFFDIDIHITIFFKLILMHIRLIFVQF